MAMIVYSLLGLIFAGAIFYGARQILKRIDKEDEVK
jgi:hypothetical protein